MVSQGGTLLILMLLEIFDDIYEHAMLERFPSAFDKTSSCQSE